MRETPKPVGMMLYQTLNNLPTGSGFFSTGNRGLVKDGAGLLTLSPLGPGHNHVDIAAAAVRAHQPLAPIGNGSLGAVSLGGVGLGLVTARLAPDDKSDTGRSRVAERHGRTWRGLLPALCARRVVSASWSPAVVHISSEDLDWLRAGSEQS